MVNTSHTFSIPYKRHDQVAAMRAFVKKRWFSNAGLKYLIILSLILSAITVSGPIVRQELTLSGAIASFAIGLAIALIATAIAFGWQLFSCSRSVEKAFDQLNLEGTSSVYSISPVGVQIADKVFGAEFGWSSLYGWYETADMLFLYRSELLFHYIPFEAVDEDVTAQVRRYLAQASVREI